LPSPPKDILKCAEAEEREIFHELSQLVSRKVDLEYALTNVYARHPHLLVKIWTSSEDNETEIHEYKCTISNGRTLNSRSITTQTDPRKLFTKKILFNLYPENNIFPVLPNKNTPVHLLPPHTDEDVDIPEENDLTSHCNRCGGAAGNYDEYFTAKKEKTLDNSSKNSNNIKSHANETKKSEKDETPMTMGRLWEWYYRPGMDEESKHAEAGVRDKTRRKKKKKKKKKKTAKVKEALSLD